MIVRTPDARGRMRSAVGQEPPPVWQPGQWIVEEVVFQFLLSPFPLGDIAVYDHQLGYCTLGIPNRAGLGFQNAPASVFVLDPVFQPFPDSAFPRLSRCFEYSHAFLGMNLLERGCLSKFSG